MEHNNKANLPNFNQKIQREIIDNYPEFLQRLRSFLDIYVPNPEKTLSQLFSRLKIMKNIGKKRTIALIPERAAKLGIDGCCAYELILNLLQLPADCSLSDSSSKKLRRAVYDAVFLDKKQYSRA